VASRLALNRRGTTGTSAHSVLVQDVADRGVRAVSQFGDLAQRPTTRVLLQHEPLDPCPYCGVRPRHGRAGELGQRPLRVRHEPSISAVSRNVWPGPAAGALEFHADPLLRHGAGAADALVPPPPSQPAHALADLVGGCIVPRQNSVATHALIMCSRPGSRDDRIDAAQSLTQARRCRYSEGAAHPAARATSAFVCPLATASRMTCDQRAVASRLAFRAGARAGERLPCSAVRSASHRRAAHLSAAAWRRSAVTACGGI
jgi:hypothetical protein